MDFKLPDFKFIDERELTSENLKKFIFGGNSTFTVLNEKSNNRFTFKVIKPKGVSVYFVKVLTGSDNISNYQFIGTYFPKGGKIFRHSRKSKITTDAQSVKVANWFFNVYLKSRQRFPFVKVYHEGKCGICGRKLTTPESIKIGIGPICNKV